MKQRRRLEITTFRRRTTVILRESEVSTGSGSDRVSQMSKVQRPMSKVMMGSEVSTGSNSDWVDRRMDSTLSLEKA